MKTSITKQSILAIVLISVLACGSSNNDKNNNSTKLKFEHKIDPNKIIVDSNFVNYTANVYPIKPHLMEISGIVQSIKNPKSFWLHEDSGSKAIIYLYSNKGNLKQSYKIKDITKFDYEDISIGLGPHGNYNHIYLGDIGDNRFVRDHIFIHRFPEPNNSVYPDIKKITKDIDSYKFKFEDGAQNSEAFILDPISGNLFLFTKKKGKCKVYTSTFPFHKKSTNELKLVGIINISGEKVTAADISIDGEHIAVKTNNYIFYWKRSGSENLLETFTRIPTRLPYKIEPQGEAFCWVNISSSYLTISESKGGEKTKFVEYRANE